MNRNKLSGGFSSSLTVLQNGLTKDVALTNNCGDSCPILNNCHGGNCITGIDKPDTNRSCTPPSNNCGQGTNCSIQCISAL